jgi:hypothetical protein
MSEPAIDVKETRRRARQDEPTLIGKRRAQAAKKVEHTGGAANTATVTETR